MTASPAAGPHPNIYRARRVPPGDPMYTPDHFAQNDADILHAFIREHPLAALIDSTLTASHVPMLLDPHARTLRCHMARANSQWRHFADNPDVLAIFTGPEHYVSPAWYPSKQQHGKVVPTWNYAAVHVYGRASLFEGETLLPHLKALTEAHDTGWRIEDAPRDYIENLTRAIVGVEIAIGRIEGKWKLSQNRPAEDREGVLAGLNAVSTHRSLELRDLMRRKS